MLKRKIKLLFSVAAIVVIAAIVLWNKWFAPTSIGFLNYHVIQLGQIAKSNNSSWIRISDIQEEDLQRLGRYDMLFINGMGLKLDEQQRALVQKAAGNGLPVLTTAATNPANDITSLDSLQVDSLMEYLGGGGRRNYRSALHYVRKVVDGKIMGYEEPQKAIPAADEMIYHPNLADAGEEDLGFDTIAEYERYLRNNSLYKEGAPKILVTGQMGEPADLIKALEKSGSMVYPIRNFNTFIRKGLIDTVCPSAVINMAHGRLGDKVVGLLEKHNIPLFSPVNVNTLVEEWEKDKMGMVGGFLSQSVVTPEIDGAIRPYALFGMRIGGEGLHELYAMPDRLETFVRTVNNYIGLRKMDNSQKKVAIYYYKGAGLSTLTAAGMEVIPSLYNLLKRLKAEGFTVDRLPADVETFKQLIMKEGALFGSYAEGAQDDFVRHSHPALVNAEEYSAWVEKSMRPESYAEVVAANGEFPGSYMVNDKGELAVSRIEFGNVVILPQPIVGSGSDSFKMVHGTDTAPTHTYIASYLWSRYKFGAHALIHFGTHGSLEFTPRKQVALSSYDWPDILVGDVPHYYIYSIGNVGEAMMAKRRSYAGIQSYLTPPFMESSLRGVYRELTEAIKNYNNELETGNAKALEKKSLQVKKLTVKMGIHRDLGMDSVLTVPYTEQEITRIENFAEELATEKVTGQLYTMGVPYSNERIISSVYAMTVEPIAYSLLALDKMKGLDVQDLEKRKALFTEKYLEPSRKLVESLMHSSRPVTDRMICSIAHIDMKDLEKARAIEKQRTAPKGMLAMMMAMQEGKEMPGMSGMNKGRHPGAAARPAEGGLPAGHPSMAEMRKKMKEEGLSVKDMMGMMKKAKDKAVKQQQEKTAHAGDPMGAAGKKEAFSKADVNFAMAVSEVERAISNVDGYRQALRESPEKELASMVNALSGGYTAPTPGGDPIVNPNTLPTGRNLYAINAEETPTESAWDKGVQLAKNTIEMYKSRHNDSIPRKVSYTLWSGEFIETEGATIAQVLYMLGVEPIRDAFGRVSDIRLIPSAELGRPRIDVVVQTSGQLRDLAASRLFLINRAVEMAAAAAQTDKFENKVAEGIVEAERVLIEKGLSPKEAREISTFRVFGGVNGNYGTGIQEMVQSSGRWENEAEIADVYMNNMGAFYGSQENWETKRQYAFEAALAHTDAVIQPRQSNTWGALSLDHVYEFMGGMNLAVRNVTGKDPDAYLSDYRNRNRVKMQEVKEAIGVESRSTLFNPAYIKEKMKGDASSAAGFSEIVQNTFGWNVMKPSAIDNEMWDQVYDVYVKDKFNLGVDKFLEQRNPAAFQDMTAIMMESARKGMWKASEQQLADIARLHTRLIEEYKPACTGTVCDNPKLQDFISGKVNRESAQTYRKNIREVREAVAGNDGKGIVMKKERMTEGAQQETSRINAVVPVVIVVAALILIVVLIRSRRKKM